MIAHFESWVISNSLRVRTNGCIIGWSFMCLCVALHMFGVRQSPNVPERCVLTAHKQFSCTWIAQLCHQLAHFAQSAGVPVFRINRLSARHSSNWVGWVDCVSVDSDSQSGLNRFWCASAHWTALSCKCTWRCVICRTSSHLSVTYVRFCLFFCEQFKKKKEHTVCVFVYIYIYIYTHTHTHTHTHTYTQNVPGGVCQTSRECSSI